VVAILTGYEAIGAFIEVLGGSPDFPSLWTELPDWGQLAIGSFLQKCDENSVLYDVCTHSSGVIDPNLIALKNWLIREKGYRMEERT
jgi:hypothetical protein